MDAARSEAGSTRITTDMDAREFTIERTFNAPRELVWKAFTEPDRLAQWWGPRGWTTTNYKFDFRPGGVWHYCMRGPDNMESWGLATYQEIVEPERLVYVDVFSDADGNVNTEMPEMLITMNFSEHDGKTTITSRTKFPSAEVLQSILDMGMVQGITETWDRLEEYLAA